jgi:hypothetical protein
LVWSPGSTFRTAFVVLRLHPSTCPFDHATPYSLRRLVQVVDNPRNRGDPTCTGFGNGPFLGDLGAVLGVVLGVVLGSPPAGGEIFLRAIAIAIGRTGRANSDHGPRKTGGQQSKDERRGDRRGKQTHDLANPRERERERGRSGAPPSSLL